MSGVAISVLFLFVAAGVGLLLYLLVRTEHDQRRTMDCESAERVARRDLLDDEERDAGRERNAERERDRFG
ncbi:hypothetical protein BRD15_06405 [Halobacteriales archaeon SW_6_65_15]|nr:MAG: hypothetical protein BRD15_06405 [Halobacteriales archaeon SW_6_65_15]